MQKKTTPSGKKATAAVKIRQQKCCDLCNCTGYSQDHDNICTCGHNSQKHSC